MTLAERCFDRARADDALFDALQIILGGRPTSQCLEDGFGWRVADCWYDHYDQSVELTIPEGQPGLMRETADKVLDLGFVVVYENLHGYEEARVWTRGLMETARSRRGNDDKPVIAKLRARIAELEEAAVSLWEMGFSGEREPDVASINKASKVLFRR